MTSGNATLTSESKEIESNKECRRRRKFRFLSSITYQGKGKLNPGSHWFQHGGGDRQSIVSCP